MLALERDDAPPRVGEGGARERARRPRADDDDVGLFVARFHAGPLYRKRRARPTLAERDGAYAWGVFQDNAAGRFVETFLVESWTEHLRQHRRVTHADRALEGVAHRYLREIPKVTH